MKIRFLPFAIAAALAASPSWADVVYTYTGKDFTSVTPPYTRSEYETIAVDFASPLAHSLGNVQVTPVSATATDGVQTITLAQAINSQYFRFTTDASGNITDWQVTLGVSSNKLIQSLGPSYSGGLDTAATSFGVFGSNSGAAGTWTESTPAPEPASIGVLGAGLAGLSSLRRRRPRGQKA